MARTRPRRVTRRPASAQASANHSYRSARGADHVGVSSFRSSLFTANVASWEKVWRCSTLPAPHLHRNRPELCIFSCLGEKCVFTLNLNHFLLLPLNYLPHSSPTWFGNSSTVCFPRFVCPAETFCPSHTHTHFCKV